MYANWIIENQCSMRRDLNTDKTESLRKLLSKREHKREIHSQTSVKFLLDIMSSDDLGRARLWALKSRLNTESLVATILPYGQ